MPLCTPIVIGPLSTWCSTLRIEGALPGATVVVKSLGPNPRLLLKELASGGSDRLSLLSGLALENGDRLVSKQQLGTEESPWTDDDLALPVGAAPTDYTHLSPVTFRSRVWQCGGKLWVQGAVPGGQVVIRDPTSVIASGQADEGGNARLVLTGLLPAPGNNILVSQEAPPGFPPLTGSAAPHAHEVEALPVPTKANLPVPALGGPAPIGCDSIVPISGIFDGADVTITRRTTGASETHTYDLDRLGFRLATPLAATGDGLRVTQAMPRCRQFQSSEALEISVAGQGTPPTPTAHPPCPDSTDILVEDLLPGAIVIAKIGSEEYRGMVPPTAASFICRVVPMPQLTPVEIRQERCGLVSDRVTVSVKGKSTTATIKTIDLALPLWRCARAVRVVGADAPCWLQVWMDGPGGRVPISAQIFTTDASRQVAVAPHLLNDRDIWVSELPCNGKWRNSPRYRAGPLRKLDSVPITVPLIEGATAVTVEAVAGASVSIFSLSLDTFKTSLIGSGIVDPKHMRVGLMRAITRREGLFAQQLLCTMTSTAGSLALVHPAVHTFTLPAPLKRNSHLNKPKPLICTAAQVICRHDGSFSFTLSAENMETKADCIYFRVDFTADWPGPPRFGAALEGTLSADGDGEITEIGLRTQGIPSKQSFSKAGFVDAFQSPEYWVDFVGTTGKFALDIARFSEYPALPEAPEAEEE